MTKMHCLPWRSACRCLCDQTNSVDATCTLIFQMNLPEGYVLEQLRNRLAKTVNVDPMLLLALSGSSSPIGRVQVRSETVDILLG